jgi:protein TonB
MEEPGAIISEAMEASTVRRTTELDRRWQRSWSVALLASVLAHVGILLLFRSAVPLPTVPTSAAGPRMGDPNAAAGGGMEVIAMSIATPPAQPAPIPEPPEPIPVPDAELPPVEVEEKPATTPAPGTGAEPSTAAGGGQGENAGPGTATGTGQGDGGDAAAGLYKVTPPSPRGLIMPPSDRPGKVRGKEVVVYVFVTDRGRVVSDSTRLDPSSGDRKFDDRLRRQAAEWVFKPASKGGVPIAEWFTYSIVL